MDGRLCICMCVCLVFVCAIGKVRVCDSDPILVFWWARWVTAALAEEAEVDEGEEQKDKEEREWKLFVWEEEGE